MRTTGDRTKAHGTKRKKILETALSAFADRGFEGITIESVAETLGYTKPAIYYYFKNKNDLMGSLVLEYLREAHEKIAEITDADSSPRERLLKLIRYYVDRNCQGKGYFSLEHHISGYLDQAKDSPDIKEIQQLSSEIPRRIISMIAQGTAEGEFRDEDPAVLGSLILSMLAGVLIHIDLPALSNMSVEKLKDTVCEFVIKGIEP